MAYAPVVRNIPGKRDRTWWYGDLPKRNVEYASTDQHPSVPVKKADPKMPLHLSASTEDGFMVDPLLATSNDLARVVEVN